MEHQKPKGGTLLHRPVCIVMLKVNYIITQAGLYSDAQGELHYYTGRSA